MAALGAAAAAAAAPPPAAAAVVLPVEAEAAPAAAAAARPASTNWRRFRLKWAKALLLLACAAAALALFAMSAADTRRVLDLDHLGGACAPTETEAAVLRAASGRLLLAAAAQVVGATTAVLVPSRPVAVFATLLGWQTGYRAPLVLRMLVACHGRVDLVLAIYYWVFVVAMFLAYVVGAFLSVA